MSSYEFLVLTHMSANQFQFLQWVDINKLDMRYISMNPKAIHFLEKYQEKINWDNLCKYNKYAFRIIKNNLDKTNWSLLAGNPSDEVYSIIRENINKITNFNYLCCNINSWINKIFDEFPYLIKKLNHQEMYNLCSNQTALPTIEKHIDIIDWNALSKCSHAFHLLEKHPNKINFIELQMNNHPETYSLFMKYYDTARIIINLYISQSDCMVPFLKTYTNYIDTNICNNENPDALELIRDYLLKNENDEMAWDYVSDNVMAINILENNVNHVNWTNVCTLTTPQSIKLIENNLDKVDWVTLSGNINAIHILENNLDKVVWKPLSGNINAIHILENNLDKVDWKELSRNYCIYEIVL